MNTDTSPGRDRAHDIVLWGATGFTGQIAAAYLVRNYAETGLRLALGGRNERKLRDLRDTLAKINPASASIPIQVGDSHDRASLDKMAQQTRVVCTTVGPYAKYGAELVAACVDAATHYCDLTAEVHFMRRMIDRHHEAASANGTRIVHSCGFDSVPSDLGVLMMQEEMKARAGLPCDRIRFYLGDYDGGFSGGTLDSLFTVLEQMKSDSGIAPILKDPYALDPARTGDALAEPDLNAIRFDKDVRQWTAPFVMSVPNTRTVRRTNALLGYAYGRDFRYSEVMATGDGTPGWFKAAGVIALLGTFQTAVRFEPIRRLLQQTVLPAPGEGPSAKKRAAGFFNIRLRGTATTNDGKPVFLEGFVEGEEDPGYNETAKMLAESAVCLALDELDSPGGVLTPASAMGSRLTDRLRKKGMRFEVPLP